jgi:hypothetical protein
MTRRNILVYLTQSFFHRYTLQLTFNSKTWVSPTYGTFVFSWKQVCDKSNSPGKEYETLRTRLPGYGVLLIEELDINYDSFRLSPS